LQTEDQETPRKKFVALGATIAKQWAGNRRLQNLISFHSRLVAAVEKNGGGFEMGLSNPTFSNLINPFL
jgi:hypothetical protein